MCASFKTSKIISCKTLGQYITDGVYIPCFSVYVKVSHRLLNTQKYYYETVNKYPDTFFN